jgi:ATP-dependent Zn protease
VDKAYAQCETILKENGDKLMEVVAFLMENETMTGAQFEACMQSQPIPDANETAMFE